MTNLSRITEAEYVQAANRLSLTVPTIKAVSEVEAPRGGFNPDGFPTTLFEGHQFHKFTKGIYSDLHPSISYPKWDRSKYRDWKGEALRLELASSLDREAAIKSASWGAFQIMGFNWEATGASSLQNFVNRMCKSEYEQLLLFCDFVENEKLTAFLRMQDWAGFAARYNGAGYKANRYDEKLEAAYKKYANP